MILIEYLLIPYSFLYQGSSRFEIKEEIQIRRNGFECGFYLFSFVLWIVIEEPIVGGDSLSELTLRRSLALRSCLSNSIQIINRLTLRVCNLREHWNFNLIGFLRGGVGLGHASKCTLILTYFLWRSKVLTICSKTIWRLYGSLSGVICTCYSCHVGALGDIDFLKTH